MRKHHYLLSLFLLLPFSLTAQIQTESARIDTLLADTLLSDTLQIESVLTDTARSESHAKGLIKGRVKRFKENIKDIHSIRDMDRMLAVKYQKKGSYDTLYLGRRTNRFIFRIRPRLSGSGFRTSGTWRGKPAESKLTSDMRFTTNLTIGYRGYSLGFSFNPFKWTGKNTNTELAFRLYNNRFGFDLSYQRTKSHNGWINIYGDRKEINSSSVTSNMFLATGYYAFNHHRFSYPAVFTQSYIQRHSAGSWLVGASLLAGKLNAEQDATLNNPPITLQLGYIGIGGGYAYNWVITPKWVMHISVLPNLVIGSFNKMIIDGHKEKIPFSFPQFIMTERLAVLYSFRHNRFTGLSFVAHNTLLANSGDLRLNYRRWRLELSYGFLF